MKLHAAIAMLLTGAFVLSCKPGQQEKATIASPDSSVKVSFFVQDEAMQYQIQKDGETLIDTSALGFAFREKQPIGNNMAITKVATYQKDTTWKTVWGESKTIANYFNGMKIYLKEKTDNARKLILDFRAYNDGIAFRYQFPNQKHLSDFTIINEMTEFAMTGDHKAWWIPADYESYEFLYTESKLSEIDAEKYGYVTDAPDRYIGNIHAANTPLTMQTGDGRYISIHEAALTDYAGMTVAVKPGNTLQAELVPWPDGAKVKTKAPAKTPWRTIQIADKPGQLITSDLIVNLNKPNTLDDVSWIEPMVYTGIWWEMHIGKSSWALEQAGEDTYTANYKVQNKHGATSENAKRYARFNAKHGIPGLLIEGWNTGWEYWGADTTGFFDFQTSYPDFDLREVADYLKQHNGQLIGHHETSGDVTNYEKHLEKAFKLYHNLGIKAVKTGYAGVIRPKGQHHHGQWMVRHYRKVLKTAAKYQIMVNAHEPIKATGIRRTYPNMMTREGVRGMEYNAWSTGNPPSHTCILPFTRGLAGPTDYTPGIFDIHFDQYKQDERVYTTLAKQLALEVMLYSPMQMAADLPENYKAHPQAFSFIEKLAVDWEETKVLQAEIGDFMTLVRKERHGERWFLAGITNKKPRSMKQSLDFLPRGKQFVAEIYADAADADWKSNPTAYQVSNYIVNSETVLPLELAPGGGAAVILRPAGEYDISSYESL